MRLSHAFPRPLLLLLLLICQVATSSPRCERITRRSLNETLRSWPIVVTATVRRMRIDDQDEREKVALVRLRRIFSGREYVGGEEEIEVHGVRRVRTCRRARLREGTTRILAIAATGSVLSLGAPPIPLSLHTLDILHALVTGQPIRKRRKIKHTICESSLCPFGSQCTHPTGVCECRSTCKRASPLAVCGTDDVTYASACHLSVRSCVLAKENATAAALLRVKHHSECRRRNPCEDLRCGPGEECVLSHDGMLSAQCACPSHCDNYGDAVDSTPVCTSEGEDFSSLCEMRRYACKLRQNVTLKFFGKCDPCQGVVCERGTVCKVEETTRKAECRCSQQCSLEQKPVCGSDGLTYANECVMSVAACRAGRTITVFREGKCDDQLHPCSSLSCRPFESCVIAANGSASCACADSCPLVMRPVCGADGITYDSECALQRDACLRRRRNLVRHEGTCGKGACAVFAGCKPPQVCATGEDGRPHCSCPECDDDLREVCASDGRTYPNECKMRQHACRRQQLLGSLYVRYLGVCEGCVGRRCEFYAACVSDERGVGVCRCVDECVEADNGQTVCGTDGVTYPSECHLRSAACRQRRFIVVAFQGKCDSCLSVECASGQECRAGACVCSNTCERRPRPEEAVCGGNGVLYPSRCHLSVASCEQKVEIAVQALASCSTEKTDASSDQSSPAITEEGCACNAVGAYGPACEAASGRCRCRPGVGGAKCDHCTPGLFAMHLIAKGAPGCTPCGCSVFGAARLDCEQTTGRCECKPGVHGLKCTECTNPEELLTAAGCVKRDEQKNAHCVSDGESLAPHCVCPTLNVTSRASCSHDSALLGGGAASSSPVCGSDGRVYDNACALQAVACAAQSDLRPVALGACQEGREESSEEETETGEVGRNGRLSAPPTVRTLATPRPSGLLGAMCTLPSDCQALNATCVVQTGIRGRCECVEGWHAASEGDRCERNGAVGDLGIGFSGGRQRLLLRPQQAPVDFFSNFTLLVSPPSTAGEVILLHARGHDVSDGDGQVDDAAAVYIFIRTDGDRITAQIGTRHIRSSSSFATDDAAPLRISLSFRHRTARLSVNADVTMTHLSPPDTILGTLAIGGPISPSEGASYVGCLHGVTLNGRALAEEEFVATEEDDEKRTPSERCGQAESAEKTDEKRTKSALSAITLDEGFVQWTALKLDVRSTLDVELRIKPSANMSDGVLLYWGRDFGTAPVGDFIALALLARQPHFFWNLGSGVNYVKAPPLPSHRFSVVRFGRVLRNATMRIDNGPIYTQMSSGKNMHLDISGESLFVGGVPSASLLPGRLRSLATSAFRGTIAFMSINERFFHLDRPSLWSSPDSVRPFSCPLACSGAENGVCQVRGGAGGEEEEEEEDEDADARVVAEFTCRCAASRAGRHCQRVAKGQVGGFFDGSAEHGYLNRVLASVEASSAANISLSLKTYSSDGIFWWQTGEDDFFLLFLRAGLVHLAVNLGNDATIKPVALRGVRVDDGHWHSVYVQRSGRSTVIHVDGTQPLTVVASPGSTELNTNGLVFLGGRLSSPSLSPSARRLLSKTPFIGCIRDVFIDGASLDVRFDAISVRVPPTCKAA